jgi:hypothetical protein
MKYITRTRTRTMGRLYNDVCVISIYRGILSPYEDTFYLLSMYHLVGVCACSIFIWLRENRITTLVTISQCPHSHSFSPDRRIFSLNPYIPLPVFSLHHILFASSNHFPSIRNITGPCYFGPVTLR